MSRILITIKLNRWSLLVISLIVVILLWIYSSSFFRTKGYSGTADFLVTFIGNWFSGLGAKPPALEIKIAPGDFKKIMEQREAHLQRGLIMSDSGTFVPGTILYGGQKIKAELRLKGHMTDHLSGEKWSFRVHIKGGNKILGMKWFSIQHPGTRNYIYEWIYHRLLSQEDIISLRYLFVRVTLNGKDKGIYALEEHFSEELTEANRRPNAPILRFNPDMYWKDRLNEIMHIRPVAEWASFQSAYIESYRTKKVLRDSLQKEYFLAGMSILEGFRRGYLSSQDVFDVPRLAKFHAILDLVGGHHSLDWSDVKYYYNPESRRIEPVGYESFSAYPIDRIAGIYRFNGKMRAENITDLHQLIFNDTLFFINYIAALEEITQPGYLDTFFNRCSADLEKNLKILYSEFPYKDFDKSVYYRNSKMIKKIITPPRAVNAYLTAADSSGIIIKAGNVESLPVEILSVSAGQSTDILPEKRMTLPSKVAKNSVNYVVMKFNFRNPAGDDDALLKNLKINYRILGSKTIIQSDVLPYPHPY
ncbi:MAG: hypothetical protein HYY40_03300 [Bacteroidetes bacterium]|nr:hypothetical protein [Bacteroidota bacterium]